MGKKTIKIKGKNRTPHCQNCGRKLSPKEAVWGVCSKCRRKGGDGDGQGAKAGR